MTTTNNLAAQASDEPMRAVVALAWKWHDDAVADGFAASEPAQEVFELLGWPDRATTPGKTTDVEREITYELVQEDIVVASASGLGAERDIAHYAVVYGQDGPCEIYRVTREKVAISKPGEPNGSA